jgi:hypothetical protein
LLVVSICGTPGDNTDDRDPVMVEIEVILGTIAA